MDISLPTIRGRGAAENPANRFERLAFEHDGDVLDEEGVPVPATVYLKDAARSIIAKNDSPDVGFTYSINAYRGCSHGCVYCLSGETRILMADGTHRPLAEVRPGDLIYGTERRGNYRRYVTTTVLAHWETQKPAFRVTLEDGTVLVASGDHRFLTNRGWKFVAESETGQRPHLTANNDMLGVGALSVAPPPDEDYQRGYLCGMIHGDGLIGRYHYPREGGGGESQTQFRLALADGEGLDRTASFLAKSGITTNRFEFQAATATCRTMKAIRTHARDQVLAIECLIEWPADPSRSWTRGFLAGIFDAEGSYSCGILRISNTDPRIIRHICGGLDRHAFTYVVEVIERTAVKPIQVVRIRGGLREHLRFFHTVTPAITRKLSIDGQALKNNAKLRVASIEPLPGRSTLFDITTGTGDFIANGVVSHNCYARPTHEYLGFSAGLDFETRILVKAHAPELLREELASPKWQPAVVAISGVTDCYQPVERTLQLTRKCLQVLAELRNPVSLITKNHLITRDIDLLAELASLNLAAAMVSVTTLDAELARRMEPRTSAPRRRLEAIELLAKAGIPVGVMVAPIIPGLTDHETPSILKAAAAAGARFAGSVPVRLPLGVAPLFEAWLARHYPGRKDKVLNRIRSLRGGKLNDSNFNSRMKGQGVFAEQIAAMFKLAVRKAGLDNPFPALSTEHFRRPTVPGAQFELFGG
ncbi:MAG TPA: PA0069 family radical SAM protein [Tepidisphaeraceae bacterium]